MIKQYKYVESIGDVLKHCAHEYIMTEVGLIFAISDMHIWISQTLPDLPFPAIHIMFLIQFDCIFTVSGAHLWSLQRLFSIQSPSIN